MSSNPKAWAVRLTTQAFALFVGAASVGLGAACGPAPFAAGANGSLADGWQDDHGASIGALYSKVRGQHVPKGASVAVGVPKDQKHVIGVTLDGSTRWSFGHALDAQPRIAGSVVVLSGAGEVVALDAHSGKKLWATPSGGLTLRGAGDDGAITAVTLRPKKGDGSLLLMIDRSGKVMSQVETERPIGRPAVAYGHVFVPWAEQYVSAIDPKTGDEAARVLIREKVSQAFTVGGELYFGEVGFFRFDERLRQASKGAATHATLPKRELPGKPVIMRPGGEAAPVVASATERVRLYARPARAGSGLAMDNNRFYASYFRLMMGFDSRDGHLTWVRTYDGEAIGAAATRNGLVVCDDDGKIHVHDAGTGAMREGPAFKTKLLSCTVQADDFAASVPADGMPLAEQLAKALTLGDDRLAMADKLLLREMMSIEDEVVTKVLVEIATDVRTSPPVLADARNALRGRRNGASYMLKALDRRYDFLNDVLRAPPVGPLAAALAGMHEKRASAPLALHLLDPSTSEKDVREVAMALVEIGSPKESDELAAFMRMYRSGVESDIMIDAAGHVARALAKYGGPSGRALLERLADDPLTDDAVRSRIAAVLASTKSSEPAGKRI